MWANPAVPNSAPRSAVNTKPGFSPGWSKVVCYFSTLTLAAIPERL
jgi:hypothetical protein